jgi:hypothetical protein
MQTIVDMKELLLMVFVMIAIPVVMGTMATFLGTVIATS